MGQFEWKKELELKINKIDGEHKVLIDYMNKLQELHSNNASFDELKNAFQTLYDYTVKHFSEEEKFMESFEYTDIEKHKAIHTKLLADLKGHLDTFIESKELGRRIFGFLEIWLTAHIIGIDGKYAIEYGKKSVA